MARILEVATRYSAFGTPDCPKRTSSVRLMWYKGINLIKSPRLVVGRSAVYCLRVYWAFTRVLGTRSFDPGRQFVCFLIFFWVKSFVILPT